jgi:hypothetical protein
MGVKIFENKALRRIFGPKSDEMVKVEENCIKWGFITCTSSPNTIRIIKS